MKWAKLPFSCHHNFSLAYFPWLAGGFCGKAEFNVGFARVAMAVGLLLAAHLSVGTVFLVCPGIGHTAAEIAAAFHCSHQRVQCV